MRLRRGRRRAGLIEGSGSERGGSIRCKGRVKREMEKIDGSEG